MRARAIVVAAAVLVVGAWSAMGQLRPPKGAVSPDETARQTYDERLSLQNALTCTKQIGSALDSFSKLTGLARPKLTAAQMRRVGNTSPETQSIAFANWVGAVEGTLRKQNRQIAKLELDLARQQYKAGKLSRKALQRKEATSRKAEKEFQTFWDSFGVAD